MTNNLLIALTILISFLSLWFKLWMVSSLLNNGGVKDDKS